MPKLQTVQPNVERAPGTIKCPEILLNQYSTSLEAELKSYGKNAIIGIYEDMLLIREFESMLQAIKMTGSYRGTAYNYRGPAHLSVGQEAACVGQAFLLEVDDHIFGSHRSHGEVLAKGLSTTRKLDDDDLVEIMEKHLDGDTWRAVKDMPSVDTQDLGTSFLVYAVLAEIFGRKTGFNRGLGGSMHAFFAPFGIYPNNAIVGASTGIAAGAALFKKINRKKGIVVANIGDAAMNCGLTWEAMNFSSMGQFHNLWDGDYRGGLPIIFNFMNNFYGMGGQTAVETAAFDMLARVGAGINTEAMHAERVDGFNPMAVIDSIRRKKKLIQEGGGPVLLEMVTYRFSGHSPSDASSYRTNEELELWKTVDPIRVFSRELEKMNLLDDDQKTGIVDRVTQKLHHVCNLAVDGEISPPLDPERIADLMYSNKTHQNLVRDEPAVLLKKKDNPRIKVIRKKSRGMSDPQKKVMQYRDAIFEAIIYHFYKDPTLVAYGEENRDWGGAFGCYRGLTESLPYHRFFNAPISEAAIISTAVGYAMEGGRVLVEIMYSDFLGRAGDEIFNQLAKWQSMSAGTLRMPVVVRVSVGITYGAQHSQDWSALVNHIPGLKVVYPATPYDAKGMLHTALSGTDPVIFFESQQLYDFSEQFEKEVPEKFYEVPFGPPAKRRDGQDLTLISVGATLYRAVEATTILAEKYDMSCDVFDCRSINPLDYKLLVESARKTGRVVLLSDACERGSVIQNIASNLTQMCFDYLDAPPVVVGSRNWITPSAEMEHHFFPQAEWIVDAIHERILKLPGHVVSTDQTIPELRRRCRDGV